MKLSKDISILRDFNEAARHEWIETNGLGGWASSSIIGAHTRRYHGLLIAAVNPPTERFVAVSKMDEEIEIDGKIYPLGSNNYGDAIYPEGYRYQLKFSINYFPEFIYEAGGVLIRKRICMVHGENTTVITYKVLAAEDTFALRVRPFIALRDYHHLCRANNEISHDCIYFNDVFHAIPYKCYPHIFIRTAGAKFEHKPEWYYKFQYSQERARGLDSTEDLFCYGSFIKTLSEGDEWGVVISTENTERRDPFKLMEMEAKRRKSLIANVEGDGIEKILTLAADQFIVKRGEDLRTVIAGYHWFADWGRDTMIALPGLCLSTGRFDDARRILAAFASSINEGMLPNRFQDNNEKPEYNNVDGTLWYFIAIHRYLEATQDFDFICQTILPVLKEIIHWHYRGTRYNIHVDTEGLLYSGQEGVQLTWMDAKIGDWVVTPRTGKAVEVNALWYNALCIYASLLEKGGELNSASEYREKASEVKRNFISIFWNEEKGYLNDVISPAGVDDQLRPNQVLALSLPFTLVEKEMADSIINVISKKLYTPVGLRSLEKDDPSYSGNYEGDPRYRDSSYHQGTVWNWLLGAYIDALMRYDSGNGKQRSLDIINAFSYHLLEGGIGTISEIFNGDAPHSPQGCIAQAWSVGEMLRVVKEYGLDTGIRSKNKLSDMVST